MFTSDDGMTFKYSSVVAIGPIENGIYFVYLTNGERIQVRENTTTRASFVTAWTNA